MRLDPKWIRLAALLSNAITVKAILIFGGYLLGDYLDGRWGTKPWLMLSGLTLGVSLGLFYIVFLATHQAKKKLKPRCGAGRRSTRT